MGPQTVSPSSIRTREVWSRKPRSGAYTCQAALEWAPKGSLRSAHPRHPHRLPNSPLPPSSSSVSLGPLCPRRVAWGSGLRCARQGSQALVGRRERDPDNSGTGFPSAWRAGACAQKSGLGQGASRTQKLRVGCRLNSALKTSLGKDAKTDCFALGFGCSWKGSLLPNSCMTLDMSLLDLLICRGSDFVLSEVVEITEYCSEQGASRGMPFVSSLVV